jgi:hypothetical protein
MTYIAVNEKTGEATVYSDAFGWNAKRMPLTPDLVESQLGKRSENTFVDNGSLHADVKNDGTEVQFLRVNRQLPLYECHDRLFSGVEDYLEKQWEKDHCWRTRGRTVLKKAKQYATAAVVYVASKYYLAKAYVSKFEFDWRLNRLIKRHSGLWKKLEKAPPAFEQGRGI